MSTRFTLLNKARLAVVIAGLLSVSAASAVTYTYRIPANGVRGPALPAAAATAASGYWVIQAGVSYWNGPILLNSDGYFASCPAGGIDPSGPGAAPSGTPGEPYNTDSVEELGWEIAANSYDPFRSPTPRMTRTWCIPANPADVTVTGDMVPNSQRLGSSVTAFTQTATPPPASLTKWKQQNVIPNGAMITANGQPWSMLLTTFYNCSQNNDVPTGDWPCMDGRKIAIGRTAAPAPQTFFGTSPSQVYNGVTYTNSSIVLSVGPACYPIAAPAPLGTGGALVDLDYSGTHSVLLKQDGSVWMTGSNAAGQFGNCTQTSGTTWTRFVTGVKSIGVGGENTYIVKTDGTAWIAGVNTQDGTDGMGSTSTRQPLTFVQIASNVKQIDGSGGSTVYLQNDGTLWFSGNNSFGDAGQGPASPSAYYNFVKVDSNVVSFARTFGDTYYLKTDNTLWVTGSGSNYKLGDGVSTGGFSSTPNKLPYKLADNVIQVTGTQQWTAYVNSSGQAFAAGYDGWYEFGKGTFTNLPTFTQIGNSIPNIIQVAGSDTTIKLLNAAGDVYASGTNNGEYGDGTLTDSRVFIKVASGIKRLFKSYFALTITDKLLFTGTNTNGTAGNGTTTNLTTYTPVPY